jgi:hypothetical protein
MAEKFPISAEKTHVHSREPNREFVVLLHGGFLLIGVVTTLLGASCQCLRSSGRGSDCRAPDLIDRERLEPSALRAWASAYGC